MIRGARQLLTLRGARGPRRGAEMSELCIIPDGAVLVKDGIIREVGPSRRVERLAEARDAVEIDASGRVVMPGLVDAGTSLLCPPAVLDDYETRCLQGALPEPILPIGYAIPHVVKQMRGYSAQFLEMEGRRRLRHFWRNGTTTLGACSGFGLDERCELRTLRVLSNLRDRPLGIVRTYGGALAIAPELEGRSEEYLEWMVSVMLPLIHSRKLAEMVSVRVGPQAFSEDQAARYISAAADLGLPASVTSTLSAAPAGLACKTLHLTPGAAGITLRVEGDAVVALAPGAEFHAGAPAVNGRALIDSGAAVALSTDYGRGPTPSLPAVMSLACARGNLSPAEAITSATINSACALGLESRAGSIEAGKDADLLIMQTGDYRDIPLNIGLNLVAGVMKRGEMIFPRMGPV